MKIGLNPIAIRNNVTHLDRIWLKPAEVAEITGLDEKWLAAAREGRKHIEGPPYVKIGPGKTSPIRYPLDGLIKWMESFPLQGTQLHVCRFTSFAAFQIQATTEQWPFVLYEDGSLQEILSSMNSGRFMLETTRRRILWIARKTVSSFASLAV